MSKKAKYKAGDFLIDAGTDKPKLIWIMIIKVLGVTKRAGGMDYLVISNITKPGETEQFRERFIGPNYKLISNSKLARLFYL
jgi:hypothetical protein